MTTTPPKNVQGFGGASRWAIRYLVDWRAYDKNVHPLQLHATILRWFHHPQHRQEALTRAEHYVRPNLLTLGEPLDSTVRELEACAIRVGPGYDAADFAFFLSLLGDGNLETGGTYDADFPSDWAIWRPAFPWMLSRWRRVFGKTPMPWPFFIFPGPNHPPPRGA